MAEIQITAMTAGATLTGDEWIEISQPSTTVIYTGITIGALAVDNSFTDSASGFITEGFAVGDRIGALGFANGANNLFVGTITALAADSMEIGGTDGDVIVDETEGASVTIFKWETHRTSLQDLLDDLVPAIPVVKYRLAFSIENDPPSAAEVMLRHVLQADVTFPDNFAGSVGRKPPGGGNPGSTQTFDILHNGSSIGSVAISTGGAFTWNTTGGALAAVAGDEIRVEAPASPDAALEGMSFTIYGEEA
jgi:hypothetical protein